MKGILIVTGGMIVLINSMAFAQSDTQVTDQGQVSQEDWIERSFDRGPIDRRAAGRPDGTQAGIDRVEGRAKVDRVLKRKEAARTGAAKQHAPRPIVREQPARQGAERR